MTTLAIGQKTISGKITNTASQPVVGASVIVKGTNTGTTTDEQGHYSINVANNQNTLIVSYVGYASSEITIGDKSNIDITLTETGSTLNEVVVTGYSSQAKKDITGSVSVVNIKELVANPGSNIQNLLQGRAAGVTIGTSGVPGAGANVRMHGYSTFGNNKPLYVVDGARV